MFTKDDKVTWIRESWYGTFRIPATIIKVNAKTVRIAALMKDGSTTLHNVKPENLQAKG